MSRPENKYYDGKGVGPVKELKLADEIDESMVKTGEELFNSKCTSCHKLSAEKESVPDWPASLIAADRNG